MRQFEAVIFAVTEWGTPRKDLTVMLDVEFVNLETGQMEKIAIAKPNVDSIGIKSEHIADFSGDKVCISKLTFEKQLGQKYEALVKCESTGKFRSFK